LNLKFRVKVRNRSLDELEDLRIGFSRKYANYTIPDNRSNVDKQRESSSYYKPRSARTGSNTMAVFARKSHSKGVRGSERKESIIAIIFSSGSVFILSGNEA
jgi:hypothetical protein